ncbi:MAG: LacI family transcriptional regulator [Candidatus Sumerlaeaceae bacterium]|nr:LacI family transcriptional regulator [Candidatus Sumerlaeaceae bacterium]
MTSKITAKKGRHTIRDIAQMAGVSRSTVSLAINDSPKINADTKKKITDLIDKVGYRPNQTARNLVRRSTETICVVLPQISHVVSNAYFSESLSGILDVATEQGYHLLVKEASAEFKEGRQALKLFRQGLMDGVLVVGALTNDKYISELAAAGCPVVLVNSTLPGVDYVISDNETAAFKAVEHLHKLGHRRIAHIRGSEFVTGALDRTAGYLKALDAFGLPKLDNYLAQGYFDKQSGFDATKWLLTAPERPTAIFTTNDMMALGAIEAIRAAGLRVPEDIAIFGGDNIQLAPYVSPALSTLEQPMDQIAQAACQRLLNRMTGEPVGKPPVIHLDLVIRESCGAKLGARG